ncbi:MAG: copper amine oxidase N-terminal domain-containing protein [Gorillibacterium sp.]|nr:copper amine oxidase N-terminal domain-containing protein [Gorillibacterium sp.]
MKKFVFGLFCGIIVSISSVAYASDSIQALLFPAKFLVNDVKVDPHDGGYEVLNYDGHTYVPIRFVAENMGSKVVYDDASKTIMIDNGFNIVDMNNIYMAAGHLSVAKDGDHSIIHSKLYIGQYAWDYKFIEGYQSATRLADPTIDVTKTTVTGILAFWNDKGEIIEKVPYEVSDIPFTEQIIDIQTTSHTDLSSYAVVTLESNNPHPTRVYGYLTPKLISDNDDKVKFGLVGLQKTGEYTIVNGLLYAVDPSNVSKESHITITFFDDMGKRLGTATTTLGAERPQSMFGTALFLGKGDFTNYKSITIEVSE